jgi:hypothetical protein
MDLTNDDSEVLEFAADISGLTEIEEEKKVYKSTPVQLSHRHRQKSQVEIAVKELGFNSDEKPQYCKLA